MFKKVLFIFQNDQRFVCHSWKHNGSQLFDKRSVSRLEFSASKEPYKPCLFGQVNATQEAAPHDQLTKFCHEDSLVLANHESPRQQEVFRTFTAHFHPVPAQWEAGESLRFLTASFKRDFLPEPSACVSQVVAHSVTRSDSSG